MSRHQAAPGLRSRRPGDRPHQRPNKAGHRRRAEEQKYRLIGYSQRREARERERRRAEQQEQWEMAEAARRRRHRRLREQGMRPLDGTWVPHQFLGLLADIEWMDGPERG